MTYSRSTHTTFPAAHRTSLIVTALLACLCLPKHAAAQLLPPGNHTDVSTLENGEWKFEIFIPDKAKDESKPKLPVMYLWGRQDDKTFAVLTEWAQERGVILVASRTKFQKTGNSTIDQIIDATDKTVTAYTNAHPYLQFAIGRVEGVSGSFRMGVRQGKDLAGIGVQAAFGEMIAELPRFQIIAFQRDTTLDPDTLAPLDEAIDHYQKRRYTINVIEPSQDDVVSPLITMADWLLWTAKLNHPGLPKEERDANAAELEQLLIDFAKPESLSRAPHSIVREAQRLLELPTAAESKNAKPVLKAWFDAQYRQASAIEDELDRHNALTRMTQRKWFESCAPADRKTVNDLLAKMRKTSPIREEWAAQQEYDKVKAMEAHLKTGRTSYGKLIRMYQKIAKEHSETFAGGAAAGAVIRLTREAHEAAAAKSK